MKKKQPAHPSKEFTDSNGEKWVQTSPDDLFSLKELNDVFEAVERERDPNEIVLARINFHTVNKEYYETIQQLQSSIKRKDDLLKRLITESKRVIKRKNEMMFEMIEYIKQLQLLTAQKSLTPDQLQGIRLDSLFRPAAVEEEAEAEAEFEMVSEIALDDDGEEIE